MSTQMAGSRGSRGVILLRPRDRLATARQRFHQAAARLAAERPDLRVVAAYVTPQTPSDVSLEGAAARLVAEGVREIAVVPHLVEWDHPDAYDVPDALYDLAEEHPGVSIRMARPLGLTAGLDELVGERLEEAWSLPRVGPVGTSDGERPATIREVADIAGQTGVTTAALKEGELPRLPAHARHLFVCFGRRCMEEGSPEAHRVLVDLLVEKGLSSGPDMVKVSRSKCLSPCQAAPVAVTYPDGTFFCRLTPDVMPEFVEEVLVKGGELAGRTFRAGG
jgi:(2Fe-2S) ferredoxin/sirohydrochlorin ferrochelatase